MVYLDDWEEFTSAAMQLYESAPLRTRYQVKYRRAEKTVVLKVTDDVKVFKYRVRRSVEVATVQKFTQRLMAQMAFDPNKAAEPEAAKAPAPEDSAPASPSKGKSKKRK